MSQNGPLNNQTWLSGDEKFMRRCLQLARRGAGLVSPNPMVGAVIVRDGKILAEGWHRRYGEAHAERHAVLEAEALLGEQAAQVLAQSTIYVNLEPCAHFGKTPPCADLLVEKKFARVVVGCSDPFPQVSGRGIEKLEAAGISLTLGVLEAECRFLNARFFTAVQKQRPYVILKWAGSADGFMAPEPYRPFWLSSDASILLSHRWRTEEDAILVGTKTARLDNPRLSARAFEGRNPVRIVIDWNLELDSSLHLFNAEAQTLIINGVKSAEVGNLKYIQLEIKEYLVPYLLFQLYLMDIRSLIVEGGRVLLEQFIKAGLWDEARVFKSPQILVKGLPEPDFHFAPEEKLRSGPDMLYIYYNNFQ